jgi:hypothetical protein
MRPMARFLMQAERGTRQSRGRASGDGSGAAQMAMTSVEEGKRATTNVAHVGATVTNGVRSPSVVSRARAGDRCGRLGGACD